MDPTNVIAQLFGPQAEVEEAYDDLILVTKPLYQSAEFLQAQIDWSKGTATFYDQSGSESLKLAIKVELVPITK